MNLESESNIDKDKVVPKTERLDAPMESEKAGGLSEDNQRNSTLNESSIWRMDTQNQINPDEGSANYNQYSSYPLEDNPNSELGYPKYEYPQPGLFSNVAYQYRQFDAPPGPFNPPFNPQTGLYFEQLPQGAFYQPWKVTPEMPKRKSQIEVKPRTFSAWLIITIICAIIGASLGSVIVHALDTSREQTIIKEFFPSKNSIEKPQSIQAILAKDLPSVVSIQATSVGVEDAGTGIIITRSGEVLTNNHVIAGASSVAVTLYGQSTQISAKVLGTYPTKDLALLKIQGQNNLPTMTFGSSSGILQGDAVVAIGNALALSGGPTVTSGIVSALDRSIVTKVDNTNQSESLSGLIQTDAPISPGNSGGPLVASNGDVIGINTATASSDVGNSPAQNIGFAIPIDSVKPLITGLEQGGSKVGPPSTVPTFKPYLGVMVETLTKNIAQSLGISVDVGALVIQIVPGSAAALSGFDVNDVIVGINNEKVTGDSSLKQVLSQFQVGDSASFEIIRGSQKLNLLVTFRSSNAN